MHTMILSIIFSPTLGSCFLIPVGLFPPFLVVLITLTMPLDLLFLLVNFILSPLLSFLVIPRKAVFSFGKLFLLKLTLVSVCVILFLLLLPPLLLPKYPPLASLSILLLLIIRNLLLSHLVHLLAINLPLIPLHPLLQRRNQTLPPFPLEHLLAGIRNQTLPPFPLEHLLEERRKMIKHPLFLLEHLPERIRNQILPPFHL